MSKVAGALFPSSTNARRSGQINGSCDQVSHPRPFFQSLAAIRVAPVTHQDHIGVGAGVLPADAVVAATYAWPLRETKDITSDTVKLVTVK